MPEVFPSAAYPYPAALGPVDDSPYAAALLDQSLALSTDDATIPRYYFTPRYSPTSTYQPSAVSPHDCDDFPTPKARAFDMAHRASRAASDFDSLYDVTDDDEAEVPLVASASVKKLARPARNRYPSIAIPSPSAWPTIEKLRSAMSAAQPTSAHQLPTPSRQGLSLLATHNLHVPAHSAEPSLDGSLTSDDMDRLSCPSTPDTHKRRSVSSASSVAEWEPVQLDLQALETLQHLDQPAAAAAHAAHEQPAARAEMQEVARPFLGLCIPASVIQSGSSAASPVSALSIPSPGGFFSSLHSTARHTWSMPQDSAPNTSTAEHFYGIPFETRRNTVSEQTATLAGSTLDGFGDNLPTSRPVVLGDDELEVREINAGKTIFQYNEQYDSELEKLSTANLERTGHWLEEQVELQAALRAINDVGSPTLSTGTHSRGASVDKTAKKSVTFAVQPAEAAAAAAEDKEPKKTTTYAQGFEYLQEQSHRDDVFIHRQTRAEAMHVSRRCTPKAHRDQLLGKFELANPVRPSPSRPVSEFYVDDPTVLKERIARAQAERQALDQMLPATWVLQALKQLNGGRLLSKAASRCVTGARAPRILDVGGVPTNDWAWQVAYDYPFSTTTTVYAGANPTANVSGPANHKHMTVPNLWTLPFPSAHFDVVSARSLYALLKTDKPLGRAMDEYDLCLAECHRVLKPGGVFDFSLIDADLMHAGRRAQAMGVEFGFSLKTRGYDAAPTKAFLPRLAKAGFRGVQRSWMMLPMGRTAANWKDAPADVVAERSIAPDGTVRDAPGAGSTADAALLTGLVGAWAWEKWLLRLQLEMGKDEERLLEGVVQVLEEGAGSGAGWRYLTGFARK